MILVQWRLRRLSPRILPEMKWIAGRSNEWKIDHPVYPPSDLSFTDSGGSDSSSPQEVESQSTSSCLISRRYAPILYAATYFACMVIVELAIEGTQNAFPDLLGPSITLCYDTIPIQLLLLTTCGYIERWNYKENFEINHRNISIYCSKSRRIQFDRM